MMVHPVLAEDCSPTDARIAASARRTKLSTSRRVIIGPAWSRFRPDRLARAPAAALGISVSLRRSGRCTGAMFADTPDPPYTAVIFTSRRTVDDEAQYAAMSERMEELATDQPGYLGIESARDPGSRFGISVSYWATESDARGWKQAVEHLDAQRLGATRWYEGYQVRVASVTREYGRGVGQAQGASSRSAEPRRGDDDDGWLLDAS